MLVQEGKFVRDEPLNDGAQQIGRTGVLGGRSGVLGTNGPQSLTLAI